MGGGKRRGETGRAEVDPEYKRIIDQMMLRFRPIAPRPVTVESSAGLLPVKEKRAKRKYVRMKNKKKTNEECNCNNYRLDRTDAMLAVTNGSEFVTNQLRKVPEWISFDNNNSNGNGNGMMSRWITPSIGLHDVDPATLGKRRQSWITVESVIGACEDWRGVEYADLEMDSCPGFISDGFDEVRWVNLAYRRMVDPNPDGGTPPPEVSVWLVVKVENIGLELWPAFSCRVRVVYDVSEKRKQMTVPCDVWKMDSGGYAWRLDVEAALSLGRLN